MADNTLACCDVAREENPEFANELFQQYMGICSILNILEDNNHAKDLEEIFLK